MNGTRRLAAILAADVAGYSRLMAADEAGTLARLKSLRAEVIDPGIGKFHGNIVGSAGDSLLIEFASAVNAVQCAVELQDALSQRNAELPEDERMLFRMGVNLGDVIAGDGTIHGDGVNIAARLEKLAEPGGVCVGHAIHDQVRGKLPYAFSDLGEQRFHNIPDPVRAFRVTSSPFSAQRGRGASISEREGASRSQKMADKPSIAVLPFTNMSGDPEQEYFSDGITEDIITELSRFRSLFVIARNSTFTYKGRSVDVVEVGKALGVRYVAEGSVRRAGSRVRVTAQLVDAETGSHLWAERFDRDLRDIFAVQDEVTRSIVTSIAPLLAAESLRMAKRKPPEDMQAYDYFLRAKPLIDEPRSIDDLREGRELCDRAIRIDPSFARAHAYRSISYTIGIMTIEADDLGEWRSQALLSAEKALSLDAGDAWSHWALAEAAFVNRQVDRCRTHMTRALALNPHDADLLSIFGFVRASLGDFDEALRFLDLAMERNPSVPAWYNWARGSVLYLCGRYAEALNSFEAFGRPNASIHRWRCATLVKLGRLEEARMELLALLAQRPNLNVARVRETFDYLPNSDDFVETLRQAGLPE